MSCFYRRSKKAALDTWQSLPEITPVFIALSSAPHEIRDDWLPLIERFVVLLYDRTSRATTVNQARKEMFARKGRKFNAIPPTRDAVVQHVKRTAFQAGHIWGQSLLPSPSIPSPQEWGWISYTDESEIAVGDTSRNRKGVPGVRKVWMQERLPWRMWLP